jgi:hypothetical protein
MFFVIHVVYLVFFVFITITLKTRILLRRIEFARNNEQETHTNPTNRTVSNHG